MQCHSTADMHNTKAIGFFGIGTTLVGGSGGIQIPLNYRSRMRTKYSEGHTQLAFLLLKPFRLCLQCSASEGHQLTMVEKQQVMKCCVDGWRILFIILNALFLVSFCVG